MRLWVLSALLPALALSAPTEAPPNATAARSTPVYVMLQLDLVSNNGTVSDPEGLRRELTHLKSSGASGVMLDVWWSIVEQSPRSYRWEPYLQMASLVQELGMRMQVIMSFHTCGGNVGDTCNISLPSWLPSAEQWGYRDQHGNINHEYISLFYDEEPMTTGNITRTPLEMYKDYIADFAASFGEFLAAADGDLPTISTVEIGLGPAGEMRYPSYLLSLWAYPGIGEFQAYDRLAQASLQEAAAEVGRPEWGHPPRNAGSYDNLPNQTEFFLSGGGESFDSEYGEFFLSWYSGALLEHGRSVLSRARSAFADIPGVHVDAKVAGIHWHYGHPSHAAELTAGYYNLGEGSGRDVYDSIARMLSEVDAGFCFTCLEMLDDEQSGVADSRPEALVLQTKRAAFQANVDYAGENALMRFDKQAFDTIYDQANTVKHMHSFTYLRLGDELLQPENLLEFSRFVARMVGLVVPGLGFDRQAAQPPASTTPPPLRRLRGSPNFLV